VQTFIHALVRQHALQAQDIAQLWAWSRAKPDSNAIAWRLMAFLGIVAGLFAGLGVIFWVAANWQNFGKMNQFMLLQALLVTSVIAAALLPALRLTLLLLATLLLGGLLAFVGQTYQTGADSWQLFAAWAGLSFVWVVVARSDALWAFWVLLFGAGLSLWSGNHLFTGSFYKHWNTLGVITPLIWAVLVIWMIFIAHGPHLGSEHRHPHLEWFQLPPNKPSYALRLSIFFALLAWCSYAMSVLFNLSRNEHLQSTADVPLFFLNSGLILLLGLWLKSRKKIDMPAFSMVVIAGNILVLGVISKVAFSKSNSFGFILIMFFVFGLIALVLLAASGKWLVRLQVAQQLRE
jgi:uncharacterized membrane protein